MFNHQSITPANNDNVDEYTENTVTVWKNTNRQMYASNALYQSLCVLCDKNERFLVCHYVKHHADNEVVIARLSPVMADAIHLQNEPFEMRQTRITGLCYFCEESKTLTKYHWSTHILTHTGEPMYICKTCNVLMKFKCEHSGCDGVILPIYALNSPNDTALTGYMCKECNYLQINRQRLIDHLTKQHDFNESHVNRYYEKVWLLPDMSPVKTIMRFDYIEPDIRFKCTICAVDFDNVDEFKAHFIEKHSKINEYTCICKERLKFNSRSTSIEGILHHLNLHSSELYQCILCENKYKSVFLTEDDILEHLSMNHPDENLKYHHLQRGSESCRTLTEVSIEKFICSTCKLELYNIDDVVDHCNLAHEDRNVDIKPLISEKNTQITAAVSQIQTNFSCDQNRCVLRSCFLCTQCNFQCLSKDKLLMHHNDEHQRNMLNVKMGGLGLVRNSDDEKFDRSLIYSCYWCYQTDDDDKYIGGNVEAIHKHWQTSHTKPTFNPFKFYVEPLGKCYYCDSISTYRGLTKHTATEHVGEPVCFVDANNHTKCLICDFTDTQSELLKHFESAHSVILDVLLFNPCEMKQELIEKLLDIDVYKKHQCVYCENDYDTFAEYERHHAMKHRRLEPKSIEILDSNCIEFFMNCCQSHVHPQEFLNHLNKHNFQFTCKMCKLKTDNLNEAVEHDKDKHNKENSLDERWIMLDRTLHKIFYRTKVLFGNGLVLYKQNLTGSTFDDLDIFKRFMETKKRRHFEQMDNGNV